MEISGQSFLRKSVFLSDAGERTCRSDGPVRRAVCEEGQVGRMHVTVPDSV